MKKDVFIDRHIGPRNSDTKKMLQVIGVKSVDELIEKTIPDGIRLKSPLSVQEGLSEYNYLRMLRSVAAKNQVFQSYIGLGYYGTILPAAIQRNIFENPGWYTAYTPYQAEIAQGRLEALLNFQTMVCDLTAMPVANASLLDEATAAAEAMAMLFSSRSREEEKNGVNVFLVSDQCFPQTIDVLKTRATPLGIKLEIGKADESFLNEKAFGLLIQYPDKNGEVKDFSSLVKKAKSMNIRVAVASDLLALALLTPPGEWNADVVFGNSQRFGVPMGYGGPHAAFFAAQEEYKRLFPGRIIGVSVDSQGNRALRMALQTREQHIRRDKATSNICTAQALLAIMASMYAVYHGPDGIKGIASQVHSKAVFLNHELKAFGFKSESKLFFDTIHISEVDTKALKKMAEEQKVNFRYEENNVFISLDQTVDYCELDTILGIFAKLAGKSNGAMKNDKVDSSNAILGTFAERKSNYLQHPVFNSYQSESELMRYIKRLENKDLSLTHSMISLGSCTMKLNAAAEMLPLTWNEFANMHPFVPAEQAQGYHLVIKELNDDLCAVTGFAAMSFQPNSGAQGEYAGLLVIKAYHEANGNQHRNVALIPSSAHGTNPASAAMCGMKIIVVKCDENGNIDVADLKEKAEKNKENLSCLMVTYPSTHGVFEESITEITKIIHDNGGQVYMDGANMNAQVGLTSPGNIGADVCHLNLHKTFAIPHGGGGPGMGPIGVAKHLVPFLPSHSVVKSGGEKGIHAVSAAPYGSALILLISYGYIKMLGAAGLKASTETAILNANYMKEKLKNHFPILYVGKNGMVAHEMILDCKEFKRTAGVEAGDIAKRLMDFGFHAPTVAFPVHDTLMVEPTESESMQELDRFCEAMIAIRNEIREIEEGKFDQDSNVIKNAPHTANMISADQWNYKYPRSKAAFPLDWVRDNKFWPSVAKVDNAHGDRNLICICPPIENYAEAEV
jgi:glycine dehydrogenase